MPSQASQRTLQFMRTLPRQSLESHTVPAPRSSTIPEATPQKSRRFRSKRAMLLATSPWTRIKLNGRMLNDKRSRPSLHPKAHRSWPSKDWVGAKPLYILKTRVDPLEALLVSSFDPPFLPYGLISFHVLVVVIERPHLYLESLRAAGAPICPSAALVPGVRPTVRWSSAHARR